MRRSLVLAVVGALLAAAPRAAAAPALPRLRAEGGFVRDPEGRVVVLRGFNASQKTDPWVPAWFGDQDAALAARLGANVVRVAVNWAGAEPERGVRSEGWLAALQDVIERLNAQGIYAVVDMHQDFWSEKYGGDGAPGWANSPLLPGGPSAGPFDPRVEAEFTRFWTDADGIQTAFVETWRWLAAALGDDPGVAGFDVLNEPYPGAFPGPVFEQGFLVPFYRRVIDAVREVAPETMVFVEPPVWADVGHPSVLAGLGRPNVVYAPHIYPWLTWSWFTPVAYPGHPATLAYDYALHRHEAEAMGGVPWWVGEWGVVRDAVNAQAYVRDAARLQEDHLVGSAWWEWRPGDAFSPVDADRSLRPHALGLVRPFPRAVAGAPLRWGFEETAGAFTLSVAQPWGTTELFVPALRYPQGAEVACAPDPCAAVEPDPARQLLRVRFGGVGTQSVTLRPPA